MSETTTPAPANPEVARFVRRANGALKRYRAMAWITGTLLLLVCVEVILKYIVLGQDSGFVKSIQWVLPAHGFVYMVYLVSVADLWSVMRWRFGRLVTMVLAGVVPVMSFILEKKVHAQGFARIAHAERSR
jgi:integral membrane protein